MTSIEKAKGYSLRLGSGGGRLRNRRRGAYGQNMISSIQIGNYRSFASAKIDGCKRINLIVGDNGSGKTALLEAIFLTIG